jgi:hypothetical protein
LGTVRLLLFQPDDVDKLGMQPWLGRHLHADDPHHDTAED